MRSEPGVSLVSGALQSSLARAQRNYPFHAKSTDNATNSEDARKEKASAASVNKHLNAYCDSVGSHFASYSADQFLLLGNSLAFEDGGFLKRSIPEDIVKDCVILKQENNQNETSSGQVTKKKKLISTSDKTDSSAATTSPKAPQKLLNGVASTTSKNVSSTNGIVKDSQPSSGKSHGGEGPNKKPDKFDNLIQKLVKLLKDKTIGKNKRKRLTKKLRILEKRKSETTLSKNTSTIAAHNLSKSPTKANSSVVDSLVNHNNKIDKPKTKMGPENGKNGVVLTNGNGVATNSNSLQLPEPKKILYPKEKIVLGWRTKRAPGAGFLNFGNTCYLNSSLQALFHIPAFVNWIQNDNEDHRRICKGFLQPTQTVCIICVVHSTLQEHSRTNSAIRPGVLDKLKAICKHFSYGRQEDAHEFLRYLFEGMERSYLTLVNGLRLDNRTKETNPLGQIFGGYIRTEVTCLQCNSVSTTFQPSAELQLDIRHSTTLEDALMLHFRREKLDNNDYKCEKCRRISQATKQYSLELPPLVLCLQLKRFTLYGNKIGKRIHCNKFLNMSRFLHKSRKISGFYADNELKYRLVALVTHLGQSPNCGHYTAIAEGSNGSYYQFDDQFVHQVSTQTALNNDAYLLIYEMDRSCQPGLTNGGTHSSSLTNPSNGSNILSPKTGSGSIVNGSPSPARKFAIPFAKTNVSNPPLKSASMMSNTDAVKTSNGPGSCIDRHIIRFGIPTNSLMKLNQSPNKINILKSGVALTNSARLYSTSTPATPSASKASVSTGVKLVPYDAIDNDEESDQEAVEELPKKANQDTKPVSSPTTKASKPTSSTVSSSVSKPNNLETTYGVKRKLEEILGPTPVQSPIKKVTINATSDWTITGYNSDPENSKKSKVHPGNARAISMERDDPNNNRNKISCGVRLPTTAPLIPNNIVKSKSNEVVSSSKNDQTVPTIVSLEDKTNSAKIGSTTPLKVVQNGHSHSSPSTKKKRKRSCSTSSSSSSSEEDRKKRKKDSHHKKKGKKEKMKSAAKSPSSSFSDSDSSSDRHHKRHKSKKKHSKRDRDEIEPTKVSSHKAEVVVNGHGRSTSKRERDASSVDREQVLRNARNPSRSPSKSTSTTGSINIFSPNKIDPREKTIVDWNGKESLLATAIEKERMAHKDKSRGDYDEELDQGRIKKQRVSRSPSRDTMTQDGNKFQTHQDRKKLVSQWSGLMNGYGPDFKDHSNAKSSPKDIKKPWGDKKFDSHPPSHHSNSYGPRQYRNNNSSYSYTAEHRNNNYPSRPYNGNNRYRHHDRNQSWRGGGRNRR